MIKDISNWYVATKKKEHECDEKMGVGVGK